MCRVCDGDGCVNCQTAYAVRCETCHDNGCDNCSPGELPEDTLTEESILKRLMIRWILEQHQDEGLKECDITEQDIRNNIVEGAGVYGSEQALMFSLVEYYGLGYKVEKDKPVLLRIL
jgi:hypothetical protein